MLSGRSNKYTYKFLWVQEIIGSELYLANLSPGEKGKIRAGLFVEMLGTETPLALQYAYRKDESAFDETLENCLKESACSYRCGEFRTIVGNDEIVWEAYGIPMSSFSRFPYPEYHTDKDNPDIISEKALEEACGLLLRAIDQLERSPIVHKKFTGTVCLSNPQYDLYIGGWQPAFGKLPDSAQIKLRALMDALPMLLEKPKTMRQLAMKVGLDERVVEAYLKGWENKGLITIRR
jgi:aminopeptidase-like protein